MSSVDEIQATFDQYGDVHELKRILKVIETSQFKDDERILETKLRIKTLLGSCKEDEIQSAKLDPVTQLELLAELSLASKDYSKAKKFAEEAIEAKKDSWRSSLVLAKATWLLDEEFDDAEDQLRDLYAKNPYEADIVAAMAEFYLSMEEYESAKYVADHAVMLNPSREYFRELQDKIHAALKSPSEDRIQNLNAYIKIKPYSMWAVRLSTMLEVQNGRFEEAIGKLRRVIHTFPEEIDIGIRKNAASIWNYVGLVQFYQGQTKSCMYAFDSAVSLEPDNPNYLIELALVQKNLYKFEEVFETLKKLRSVNASDEIRKQAHFIFLETLSLSASMQAPGEKQLYQLLRLFRILGVMSVSEWYSSRALSLAISNALTLLRKYDHEIVNAFILQISNFARKCGISKKEDILKTEIAIMLNVLSNSNQTIGGLNEAGVRLMEFAIENKSGKLASFSRRFFRKAILTPGQDKVDRSNLYLNLGLTFCIENPNLEKATHCFLRSLKLYKNNPSAYSLIGFLCLESKNLKDAERAFSAAWILDPFQLEHWIGRGILAQLKDDPDNIKEIIKNFQHSLTIKPCPQVMQALAYYVNKGKELGLPMDIYENAQLTLQANKWCSS